LKDPAQALVYDEEGAVNVNESEASVEQIYEAGNMLQEAIDYPCRTGGIHLRPVSQRAEGLTSLSLAFCKQENKSLSPSWNNSKRKWWRGAIMGKWPRMRRIPRYVPVVVLAHLIIRTFVYSNSFLSCAADCPKSLRNAAKVSVGIVGIS